MSNATTEPAARPETMKFSLPQFDEFIDTAFDGTRTQT